MKISRSASNGLILLCLTLLTLGVFSGVTRNGFVTFDDNLYITDNLYVKQGLTPQTLAWAFSNLDAGFYHPLTWLTLLIDGSLHRDNPGGIHLTALLFHLLNTLLLFWVLYRLTGMRWPAVFAAALFAIHPAHVESVAWAAQRKDVVSTFFLFLTLLAYLDYVKDPGWRRGTFVILSFTLGLLAKPMLVTLPLVLLLLDYWPLNRLMVNEPGSLQKFTKCAIEKVPLLVLAFIAGIVAIIAEGHLGALPPLHERGIVERLANVPVSYVKYLATMICPRDLTAFYPHPGMPAIWQVAGALAVLAAITVICAILVKKLPWLITGWLWFLITLLPVIGIIQVGAHAMADRYTYVSFVGLSIMLAWGAASLRIGPRSRAAVTAGAAIMTGAFSLLACSQVDTWKDSKTLYNHMMAVCKKGNYLAQNNLGLQLYKEKNYAEAENHFRTSLKIRPSYCPAMINLGGCLYDHDKTDEALRWLRKAAETGPESAAAYINLGIIARDQKRSDEAILLFRRAKSIEPRLALAPQQIGYTLRDQGLHHEAIKSFVEVLRLQPLNHQAHYDIGAEYAQIDSLDSALFHFIRAVRLKPDFSDAYTYAGNIFEKTGKSSDAISFYQIAIATDRKNAKAFYNLGVLTYRNGDYSEAEKLFRNALKAKPRWGEALNMLGACLVLQNRSGEGIVYLEKAVALDPKDSVAAENLKKAQELQASGGKLVQKSQLKTGDK
jgi:tetratricopeptide (TPR) repeat protein